MTDTVTVTFRKEVRDRVANAVWLRAQQLDDERRHAIGDEADRLLHWQQLLEEGLQALAGGEGDHK